MLACWRDRPGYNLIETSLGREIRFEYVLQTSSPSQTLEIKSTVNVFLVRDLNQNQTTQPVLVIEILHVYLREY